MVNLFDIAHQAQRGLGLSQLGREFGLPPGQAERAVDALLPAFTLAFQRLAFDPSMFASLAGLIGSGQYAPFYDGNPSGPRRDLGALVPQIFGSEETARQVAAQASAMTGVAAGALQRMLPAITAMLVGGMSRAASVEGFADFLRHWSDALKAANPPPSRPATPGPWAAWGEMVASLMGPGQPRRPAPEPDPFEAWSRGMQALLGAAAPTPPPAPAPSNPVQALSQMFETGQEVQAQYLAALQSIIGGAWPAAATPAR